MITDAPPTLGTAVQAAQRNVFTSKLYTMQGKRAFEKSDEVPRRPEFQQGTATVTSPEFGG